MRLKYLQTMATAVEQLVIDSQSRFLEMKSLQPYSTRDEYLYAMKEDLADWLSNMYPDWRPITADTFIECLENGVLLCQHANNVNDAARKAYSLKLAFPSSSSSLENCKYRSDARPQTFNARDNVSQFIKWSRLVAGVREVLMFESDDLILRKNEKNFILCLLEIARYGARFGLSVPAIIKLENEIEREIELDKQTEILSFAELKRLQRDEEDNQKNKLSQSIHNDDNQIYNNAMNTSTSSNSSGANWLKQQITRIPKLSNNNSKRKPSGEESYDVITPDDVAATTPTLNKEPQIPLISLTLGVGEAPIVPLAASSQLHKTVTQIVNSCCCAHRFPVVRIGEGKYRIGENGTIIFIRILRYHVMVRVGGGWDTLENYLNKHDPCRRSGHHHRRSEHHNHNSEIPILALPNTNISPSVQKNTPFGKSVTLKTEEFPLSKPTSYDTNLADAQLFITRDADGHHRIGQITYKSEEDTVNQQAVCPHHHNQSPPIATKAKSARGTGRFTPTSMYSKQSSPSTDQDYSSLTETTTSKPSSSSSLDFKEESIEEPMKSLSITSIENRPVRRYSPVIKSNTEPIIPPAQQQPLIHIDNHPVDDTNILIKPTKPLQQDFDNSKEYQPKRKLNITESVIDTIDGYVLPTAGPSDHDFDISDIEDVMGITKKIVPDEDTTNMDNDSLESIEGVIEEKPKVPAVSHPPSTKKSSGYCTALYLAQKQKYQQEQAANRKKSAENTKLRSSSRSGTLPNVAEAVKKEEQAAKHLIQQRRKPVIVTRRSQSSELLDNTNDISKLDRDSGYDEQDFRRERLHSNGDDNSSVSSMKSTRSSTARSSISELRENKSYELRLKKLDTKRNSNTSSRRGSDMIPPIPPTNKYRKNSQPIVNLKQQTQ